MDFAALKERLRKERAIDKEKTKLDSEVDVQRHKLRKIPVLNSFSKIPTISRDSYCLLKEGGLWYIPNIISVEEENALLEGVLSRQWVELKTRKLQCYEGASIGEVPDLKLLAESLESCPLDLNISINHILVNNYAPAEGILHHEDGPAYVPVVAILSLNEVAVMTFRRKPLDEAGQDLSDAYSLVLQPRSLLVFSHALYERYLHGIYETASWKVLPHCCNAAAAGVMEGQNISRDRNRVSITLRHRKA